MGQLIAQNATSWTAALLKSDDQNQFPRTIQALVHALPQTSHVCAALLQYDTAHYGSFYTPHLTNAKVIQLLTCTNNHTLQTEAAWMVEGLARREIQTVHHFVQDTTNGLLHHMIAILNNHNQTPPTVQLPLWRAMGHLAVADEGTLLPKLLQTTGLVQAGTHMLQQPHTTTTAVLSEALATIACLLCDAGIPNHPSTTIAMPTIGNAHYAIGTQRGL